MIMHTVKKMGIPVVYDAHNVETERFQRMSHIPFIAAAVKISESYFCSHVRAVLTVSREDQNKFDKYFDCESHLLPNGVDTEQFKPRKRDPMLVDKYGINRKQVVLYFGNFDYAPNREALQILINKIWPVVNQRVNDSVLLVIGRNPPAWSQNKPGVIVTGAVEDIAAHICLANVIAIPLLRGGGTRLKIIESLACGQTILSTPKGAEGIEIPGKKGVIISPMEKFSDDLVKLLHSRLIPCATHVSVEIAREYKWKKLLEHIDWKTLASESP
jgi:glycosyltransferase involved in cell wall biosynthesis